ncbi:MAG: hypothetical protein ACI8W8_004085, partial [Rhodothermales bacterium]
GLGFLLLGLFSERERSVEILVSFLPTAHGLGA